MPLSPVLVTKFYNGTSQSGGFDKSNLMLDKTSGHSTMGLSFNSDEDFSLPTELAERLVRRTELRVSQVLDQSPFVKANSRLFDLPQYEREDIDVGEAIAFGGFSTVYGIKSFCDSNTDNPLPGPANKYILKNLTPRLALNQKKLLVGAKDLVMEAHFLSALRHKNIIELRGLSAAGVSGFSETCRADGFFLIYDRLTETLGKRIASWRDRTKETKRSSLTGTSKSKQPNLTVTRAQLFSERLQTTIDIAAGLEYLHSRRILFRDLKPANVGYDSNGVLKIFDFGLAVELPPTAASNSPETAEPTYNLAGNTGTSRYMAVEIIRKEPYNCKADVFSFAVLLWEVIALTKPYDGMTGQQVKEVVAMFGERPEIPRTWPSSLRKLLKRGWHDNLADRPSIVEMKAVLEKIRKESLSLAAPKKGIFSLDLSSHRKDGKEGKSKKGFFGR